MNCWNSCRDWLVSQGNIHFDKAPAAAKKKSDDMFAAGKAGGYPNTIPRQHI